MVVVAVQLLSLLEVVAVALVVQVLPLAMALAVMEVLVCLQPLSGLPMVRTLVVEEEVVELAVPVLEEVAAAETVQLQPEYQLLELQILVVVVVVVVLLYPHFPELMVVQVLL
jgi:hypothetical protein